MQAQQQRAAVQEESVEDESLGPQLVSRLEVYSCSEFMSFSRNIGGKISHWYEFLLVIAAVLL